MVVCPMAVVATRAKSRKSRLMARCPLLVGGKRSAYSPVGSSPILGGECEMEGTVSVWLRLKAAWGLRLVYRQAGGSRRQGVRVAKELGPAVCAQPPACSLACPPTRVALPPACSLACPHGLQSN